MKKRIAIYIVVGAALAAGLFYWLYIRPLSAPAVETVAADGEAVKRSVAAGGKVLVIGVDGMEWSVALELVSAGRMPNLARLLTRSAHGKLNAPAPLISPAIWTSIATGRPREVHGIDNFFAKVPFEYRETVMTSRHRNVPALWQMADWAGKSVGVVNWYAARPAEKLAKGVFVAEGIDTPGRVAPEMVYPESWLERVRTAPFPQFLAYEEELKKSGDPRLRKAYDQDRMIFSISLEILRETRPDLMMTYFQNVDVVSHGFWKYGRPIGLDYNFAVSDDERKKHRDAVDLHYEFTDRLIGGLLGEAQDYTVILLSDHGFGASYPPDNIFVDLNKLLERLGYLSYQGPTCEGILAYLVAKEQVKVPFPPSDSIFTVCQQLETETGKWIAHGQERMEPPAVDAFLSVNYMVVPAQTDEERESWENIMNDLSLTLVPGGQRQEIFWNKTKASNGKDFHKRVQGIYLNLQDREPEGAVARDEYESVRRDIIKSLRMLTTDRRRKLFKSVIANPDKPLMPTTLADPPDILVEIDREALTDLVAFRGPGDPDPVPLGAIRWSYFDVNGDHRPGGVFLISGDHAQTFARLDANDIDIAPTALWLLGLPIGADMEGRVLSEAFDEPLRQRAPLYINSYNDLIKTRVLSGPIGPSPEMEDRMKALGYIQGSGPAPEPQPGSTP